LTKFEGDNEPLAVIDSELKKCLLSERKQMEDKSAVSGKYILIPLLLIFAIFGYWAYDNWLFEQRRENYLDLLLQQQGIVVTENDYQHGELVIKGLYDPLIADPDEILEGSMLQANEVKTDWQAYHSLVPAIAEQRLKQVLQAPPLVKITLKETRLILTGVADKTWIKNLETITPVLTGVTAIEYHQLQTYPQFIKQQLETPETVVVFFHNGRLQLQGIAPIAWRNSLAKKIAKLDFIIDYQLDKLEITEEKQRQALSDKLENQFIYFKNGSEFLETQSKKLLNSVSLIKEINYLSKKLEQTMYLIITGYTDGLHTTQYNAALAQERAEKVINYLKQQAIPVEMIISSQLSTIRRSNKSQRKVGFAVIFDKEEK
jgi:outer membrane protein OmpA-like peptidoglycan-associated protein